MRTTIKQGYKSQLTYMRDRYNYLLQQKTGMEEQAAVMLRSHKDLQAVNAIYMAVVAELLTIDDKRTQLALGQRHKQF